jgi:hypothetical protein
MCLHGVAWLKTGSILPFYQFSTYIIYLFIYAFIYLLLVCLQWQSSDLTYNPLVSNERRVGQNVKKAVAAFVRYQYSCLDEGSKNTKVLI